MSLTRLLAFLLLGMLLSCHSASFDQTVWLANPNLEDTHNPRARMVQDVLDHHLQSGMSRKSVVALLGVPYKDGIERRLPKTTVLPDSLSPTNPENRKPENQNRLIDQLNNFYRMYTQPVRIMRYPVGWSTIDPNFLLIQLSKEGVVEAYWVEQG